jgi:hypothetical protein
MAEQEEKFHVGHHVMATIKSVKGTCHWYREVDDAVMIELRRLRE